MHEVVRLPLVNLNPWYVRVSDEQLAPLVEFPAPSLPVVLN